MVNDHGLKALSHLAAHYNAAYTYSEHMLTGAVASQPLHPLLDAALTWLERLFQVGWPWGLRSHF